MQDLGEFDSRVDEKQVTLMKKQQEFELEEKNRLLKKDELDILEKIKAKRMSWAVIIAMGILVLFLALVLL